MVILAPLFNTPVAVAAGLLTAVVCADRVVMAVRNAITTKLALKRIVFSWSFFG